MSKPIELFRMRYSHEMDYTGNRWCDYCATAVIPKKVEFRDRTWYECDNGHKLTKAYKIKGIIDKGKVIE